MIRGTKIADSSALTGQIRIQKNGVHPGTAMASGIDTRNTSGAGTSFPNGLRKPRPSYSPNWPGTGTGRR